MNSKNLQTLAYHEAGHAVAAIKYGIRFRKVTIISDEKNSTLGHVLLSKFRLKSDYNNSDKTRIKAEKFIKSCLAGPIAEMKNSGRKKSLYAGNDYEQAFGVGCQLHGPMTVVNAYISYLLADTEALFTYLDEEDLDNIHTPAWKQVQV